MKNKKLILIAIAAVLLVAVALTVVLIASNSNKGEAGDEEKYTVTFESNADGVISMPQKQIIEKGNYVTAPSTPSKEGYEFFGWSINSDTEAWTFNPIDFSTYPINSDTVFYAIWYSSELDVDSDGLSHSDEQLQNTDAFQYDTDSDGLSDGEEVNIFYSDPTKNDTDGDGITDGVEIALCLNPLKTHSDGITCDTDRTLEAVYEDLDNSFELSINASATLLSSVSLQTVDTTCVSNPIGLISPIIEIQYDKTNNFDSAKLVFDYSNSDLTDIDEDNLTFLYINEETNQYEEIPWEVLLLTNMPSHLTLCVK